MKTIKRTLSIFKTIISSALKPFSSMFHPQFSIFNYSPFRGLGGILALSFLLTSCSPTFEQNEQAMALSIDVPGGSVQLSGNPVLVTGSTTRQSVTNQYMLLKVTCTDGAIPGGPWTDAKPGTSATFDISALVDTIFQYTFNTGAQWINHYDELAANITVEIGERWSTYDDFTPQENWEDITSDLVILKGKLDQHTLSVYNNNGVSFYTEYIQKGKFLTNRFNEPYQKYWVASIEDNIKVWSWRGYTAGAILTTVYYTDGTNDSGTVPWGSSSQTDIYEFEANKFAEDIADPAKTVERYEFQVGADETLEKIIVYVSNNYHEVHEEFLILNNRSGIENLHCYGNLDTAKSTEKETFGIGPSNATIFQGTVITQSKSNKNKYKVNTGFKTLHERKWIADLLESNIAWWKSERLLHLTGKDYGIAPINLLPGSFPIDTTSEDLMSIEFEFEIAYNE